MIHFSSRISNTFRSLPEDDRPNLIDILEGYAKLAEAHSPGWQERVGDNFAKGHREATGGIIPCSEFEILTQVLEIGVKPDKESSPKKVKKIDSKQKNTLDVFFGRSNTS
jgi:hypothetical protein